MLKTHKQTQGKETKTKLL